MHQQLSTACCCTRARPAVSDTETCMHIQPYAFTWQCFGEPGVLRVEASLQRSLEENAWLRRMLEREQEARQAAEQALAAERLRNALLEREVLAAAQVPGIALSVLCSSVVQEYMVMCCD